MAGKKKPKTKPTGQTIRTFLEFLERKEKIKVMYGGAGSGKSVAAAQHICMKCLENTGLKIMVIRKTLPSLRITAYPLILKTLSDWGIPYDHWKGERRISINGNDIFFNGLDDPEKVKSFEADIFWVEEATELSKDDITQLTLRLNRTDSTNSELILTFNPIDAYHFLITDFVQGNRSDVAVHHSTYKDNKFLSDDFIKTLKDLEKQDLNFYRIYTLGEPGVLQGLIYSNYQIDNPEAWPDRIRNGRPEVYGLDFGYNNPTSLTAHWMYDGEPHTRELLHQSHMTNADLIHWMNENKISKTSEIYCDAAEPARIEELKRAGFNAKEADKSVKDGIDFIKSRRWHIASDSVELVKEVRNYKYKEKDGVVIDEPVKAFDHAMDSSRYALYTHYKSLVTRPDSSRFLVSHMGRMKK